MHFKRLILTITLTYTCNLLFAQDSYNVSDSLPLMTNGLKIGYTILKEGEKEVGNKGNFSRFVISFYVTNTTDEAKIMLHKSGWTGLSGDISPELAKFDCSNATGARLTAKTATIEAKPCNILAMVEDKDCASNKTIQNKRFVNIGYWIKAGETITNKQIMIVPLNEKPIIRVAFLLNHTSEVGSLQNTASDDKQQFVKIKNFWKSTYLNTQSGTVNCSNIENDWWSAQWELKPVSGTNYYVIQNRVETYFYQ